MKKTKIPEQKIKKTKPTLLQLAKKYSTDKLEHSYIPEYSKNLPKKVDSMLEIGVAMGASARMWKEYYPKAKISLFDLFTPDPEHVTVEWGLKNNFIAYQGDQGNLSDLAKIKGEQQVIIDDGSHRADHQIISFKHLFHNNLASGGVFAIEDCHCNKNPFYNGGYVTKFEDTPLWMFKNYIETGEIVNPYFNEGEQAIFKNLIKDVKIVADEKLILIWRN